MRHKLRLQEVLIASLNNRIKPYNLKRSTVIPNDLKLIPNLGNDTIISGRKCEVKINANKKVDLYLDLKNIVVKLKNRNNTTTYCPEESTINRKQNFIPILFRKMETKNLSVDNSRTLIKQPRNIRFPRIGVSIKNKPNKQSISRQQKNPTNHKRTNTVIRQRRMHTNKTWLMLTKVSNIKLKREIKNIYKKYEINKYKRKLAVYHNMNLSLFFSKSTINPLKSFSIGNIKLPIGDLTNE